MSAKDRHMVRCLECYPPIDLDAVLIFAHWRDVHDLHFEIRDVPPDLVEAFEAAHESGLRVYEVEVDRLEARVAALNPLGRWYYMRQIRELREEISRIRDDQIERLLRDASE